MNYNYKKRIYIEDNIGFITFKTENNYPYFENELSCHLLHETIEFASKLNPVKIFAYKINPDHIHILLQTDKGYKYSEVVASIKRNFSRDIKNLYNLKILTVSESFDKLVFNYKESDYSNDDCNKLMIDNLYLKHECTIYRLLLNFYNEFSLIRKIKKFGWQKSFHCHIIRDQEDFINHLEYIQNQSLHHNLKNNNHLIINENIINEII